MEDTANWLPLLKAAQEVQISPAKLSQMVDKGQVETRRSARDLRLTLVNMEQLRKLMEEPEERIRRKRKNGGV